MMRDRSWPQDQVSGKWHIWRQPVIFLLNSTGVHSLATAATQGLRAVNFNPGMTVRVDGVEVLGCVTDIMHKYLFLLLNPKLFPPSTLKIHIYAYVCLCVCVCIK